MCVAGAIVFAVANAADGLPIDTSSCCRRSLNHLGSLIFAELRVVGLILLIVFLWAVVAVPSLTGFHRLALVYVVPLGAIALCGIFYFCVRWAFAIQAVIIEEADAAGALSMSARIVEVPGGMRLLFGGFLWILGLALGAPGAAIVWMVSYPIGEVLSLAIVVVLVPFSVAASTLLFFDLQSRERERVSIARKPSA